MTVHTERDGVLSVSGALTFASVAALYHDAKSLLGDQTTIVDLQAVSSTDSAGLALLLEWQAGARQRGARLKFINAPDELMRLAVLSESTALLGLISRPEPVAND